MEMIIELTFTLSPETLEGGYTRYSSSDLPGFRILCEPKESPLPIIQSALKEFMPPMMLAVFREKIKLKGLRIRPSFDAASSGKPPPITMEATLARV